MTEADRDPKSQPESPATERTSVSSDSDAASEMRRQMVAAKERMRKYHAVYANPGGGLVDPEAPTANRSEDQ